MLRWASGLGLVIAGLASSLLVGQVPTASASKTALSPSSNALKFCGFVTGDHFNYHAVGGAPLSGSTYNVSAFGISCSAARSYTTQLSYAEPKTYIASYGLDLLYNAQGTKFANWPPHFICAGNSYTLARHHPPTISGACWKGGTNPFSLKNTGYLEFRAVPSQG
jgi:hypothetical protein